MCITRLLVHYCSRYTVWLYMALLKNIIFITVILFHLHISFCCVVCIDILFIFAITSLLWILCFCSLMTSSCLLFNGSRRLTHNLNTYLFIYCCYYRTAFNHFHKSTNAFYLFTCGYICKVLSERVPTCILYNVESVTVVQF